MLRMFTKPRASVSQLFSSAKLPVTISHSQDFHSAAHAHDKAKAGYDFANHKKPICHYKRRKRRRYRYADNRTAALAFPYEQETLNRHRSDASQLLALSKKNIIEHAARRVDLFFYTLVAYYQTGLNPVRGKTYWQHGVGRNSLKKSITQACHSSFFGSFQDGTFVCRDGLLSNTHFLQSLNATMELPWFVNKLDDEFENTAKCRESSIQILQRVSKGKINPVQGLEAFLSLMSDVLFKLENGKKVDAESRVYLDRKRDHLTREDKLTLLSWVKGGTLKNHWDAALKKPNKDYIRMLLRMPVSQAFNDKNVLHCTSAMQQEILSSDESESYQVTL